MCLCLYGCSDWLLTSFRYPKARRSHKSSINLSSMRVVYQSIYSVNRSPRSPCVRCSIGKQKPASPISPNQFKHKLRNNRYFEPATRKICALSSPLFHGGVVGSSHSRRSSRHIWPCSGFSLTKQNYVPSEDHLKGVTGFHHWNNCCCRQMFVHLITLYPVLLVHTVRIQAC